MRTSNPFARRAFSAVFFVVGLGAAALACNADVQKVCFEGDCPEGGSGSGSGGSGGGGGGTTTTAPPEDGDFPCDVFMVLQTNCHVCHNAEHLNGAPIDLLTCSRFHEADCGSKTRLETAQSYVSTDFMPLGAMMPAADKKVILDWLDGGAVCADKGKGCTDKPGTKACYE
jgi:hypothetical protein